MDKQTLIERFNGLMEEDDGLRRACSEHIANQMVEADVRFGEDIIPTFLRPFFITEAEEHYIKAAVEVIMQCAKKLLHLYGEDPQVAEYLELSGAERELFAIPHGYDETAVICRLDGFLSGGKLQFLELNCDTPAGMGYGDKLAEIFLSMPVVERLSSAYRYQYVETLRCLLEALLACYKSFGGRDNPTIALVGWEGLRTRPEFRLIAQTFESQGYRSIICDPRDMEYHRGHLTFDGERVHLIYRKVITGQFLNRIDDLQPVLKAYRDGAVCMVNPFASKLLSYKAILYFMTDPNFLGQFTAAEQKALAHFIPWTRRIAPGQVWYEGGQEDLLSLIRKAKDRFVIKPSDAFGGKGVAIGRETGQSRWDDVIEEALGGRWVVQEWIEIPEERFPYTTPDGGFGQKKVNLNPFALGARYSGNVARVSLSSVINVSAGGGILPVLLATDA